MFQVLSHAPGLTWNGTIANPSNPFRRDTAMIGSYSTIVLQIEANNPGVWPLHCHVAWHLSLGMAVQFIEQKDKLKEFWDGNGNGVGLKAMAENSCTPWERWVANHGSGQIDSGWSLNG